MTSVAKPRKLVIVGSDGKTYRFLCKPMDDLRKDSRLMECTALVNRLLRKDAESRKRNLREALAVSSWTGPRSESTVTTADIHLVCMIRNPDLRGCSAHGELWIDRMGARHRRDPAATDQALRAERHRALGESTEQTRLDLTTASADVHKDLLTSNAPVGAEDGCPP